MRRDEICNDVLVLLMKGLMYHSLVCVLYNVAAEKPLQMDLHLLILYIPLFLFAVIRRKCGKFFLFILFHVAVSGVFLLIFSGLEEWITIGGCTAIMAIVSVRIRFNQIDMAEQCPSIFSLVLFLISYFVAGQSNQLYVMQICYYEAFLFLILYLAYRNLASMTTFIKENERIENLPARQMKGINQMLLGVFILFLALGMLLIPYLPMSALLSAVGELLLVLIRGILMFLIWIFTRKTLQMEFFRESVEGARPSLEVGKTSMLAQIFEKFFMTVAYVLLAAGAVYLLVRVIYELYQKFYEKNKETADESEFIWENPVRKVRMERKGQKKEFFAGRNINQRIRHLYKKSVQRQFGRKTNIPESMTLTELEELIMQKYEGEAEKLKIVKKTGKIQNTDGSVLDDEKIIQRIMLYQKARYSQYECGKQELETVKQNLYMPANTNISRKFFRSRL